MIPENDELLWLLAPADDADDAAQVRDAFFVLHVHLDRHRAGADAIRDRKPALPVVGCAFAAELLQDGGGIPLVPPPARRARLKLTGQKIYNQTGTVSLDYSVQY